MSLPQTVYFSISNFLYKLTQPTIQYISVTDSWQVRLNSVFPSPTPVKPDSLTVELLLLGFSSGPHHQAGNIERNFASFLSFTLCALRKVIDSWTRYYLRKM